MSYQGNENTQRFQDKKTWPDRYLVENVEQTVTIIDGKVTIVIPHLELVIVAKVKGTKGRGVADADGLIEPTEAHLEILEVLYEFKPEQKFTTTELMDRIDGARCRKKRLFLNQMPKEGLIDRNASRRPISELLRKKAIIFVEGSKNQYVADHQRVTKILEEKKF